MSEQHICTNCYFVGIGKKAGSGLLEFIGWISFILPGMAYGSWRRKHKHSVCPKCHERTMIPLDTPKGQELLQKTRPLGESILPHNANPTITHTAHGVFIAERGDNKVKGVLGDAALVLLFILFLLLGFGSFAGQSWLSGIMFLAASPLPFLRKCLPPPFDMRKVRVYTPSTRNERDDLFLPWSVLLLSMMPETDPDKVTQELLDIFEHEEFFPDADNSIRRLVRDFEMMKKLVSDADQAAISGAFSALRGRSLPDLEFPTALEKYNKIIDGVLSGISQKREVRISERPIDPQRLDEIENAACEKGFNQKTGKFPLYIFEEILTTKEQLKSFTNRHDRHERGSLTNPLMDQPVSNEKSWWSSTISDYVAGVVLGDVLRQSEKTQAFASDGITYWQAIANFMGNDKSSHILVVSGRGDPEWLREWEWGTRRNDSNPLPNGVTLWRSEDYKDKQGYRFHLNSLPVFQAGIEDGHSFLLPKSAFKKLEFTIFDNNKTVKAEVEAITDDPWHVVLKLIWSRRVTVGTSPILEIKHTPEPDNSD